MKTSGLQVNSNKINKAIFFITFCIVAVTYISVIFPSFFMKFFYDINEDVKLFELGTWALPVLLCNLVLIWIWFGISSKKLPEKIKKLFDKINEFDISKNIALVSIVLILSIYVALSANELVEDESNWTDFIRIKQILDDYPKSENASLVMKSMVVKNFLLYSSQEIFDNIKIIPFLGSISLLLVTYFFTVKITQKKLSGVIALVILVQSHTFLRYDTTATFSNFWTLFYLLSLYLIHKNWTYSHLSFVLSILSKTLTGFFIPLSILYALTQDIPKKTKYYISIIYAGMAVSGLIFLFVSEILKFEEFTLDLMRFVSGFTTFAAQLRFDVLLVLFLLPLVVALYFKSKNGRKEATGITIMIAGMLLIPPLLTGTLNYNIMPYRYIPLIVFFSIGIGVLFSKNHSIGSNQE